MALGSAQPLTEMSTRNISWCVKVASKLGLDSWKRLSHGFWAHPDSFLSSDRRGLLTPGKAGGTLSWPVSSCRRRVNILGERRYRWALDEGERSALSPGHLTLGERAPGTRRAGDFLGLWACLDVLENIKISHPCRDSNPWMSNP